ncbi:hypothetical protein B484DRAFT_465297 [Ochromonadaceae sp. CCMP2298]|nr:hypothetical protein B484DRAFT_465297 [Ochromonadaceae sp. CCMP2298]|mmetsp:Transcript_22389/g.48496  ORF Transcript_22389/g.48496 Transcript_22389/m.48496 type:complete len:304 (+) Transcript_22389:68-979(+)
MSEFEVVFDWEPENEEDLRLYAGERVEVLQRNEHGWWYGVANRSGTLHKGYFPKNYVKEVPIEAGAPPPPPRPSLPKLPEAPVEEVGGGVGALTQDVAKMEVEVKKGPTFSLKSLPAFDDLMELGYAVEIEGVGDSGEQVISGMRVELRCTAKIWDGATTITKEFANGVICFVAGEKQVTAGLDAAIQRLCVGQRATITCSPHMAYGAAGNPPAVPPNSFVVFAVEVLSVGEQAKVGVADSAAMLLDSGIESRNTQRAKGEKGENWRASTKVVLVDSSVHVADIDAATPPAPASESPTSETQL